MRSATTILGAFALLLGGAGAGAAELQLGNLAPGSGRVQFYADGEALGPELAYGEFAQVEQPDGRLPVAALRRGVSDEVLATHTFQLGAQIGIEPVLVLAGNGDQQPYDLRLYQNAGDESSEATSKRLENASIALHHLAPYTPGDDPWLAYEEVCRGHSESSGSQQGSGGQIRYGHARTSRISGSHEDWVCVLRIADPVFGAFQVEATPKDDRTTRFFLAGDGEREPFQVMVVERGAVVELAGPATPAPGAVVQSRDLWYDLSRPAQAVALYELAGGERTLGFWFTQGEDGLPEWFYFDGTATGLPGQRELVVSRGTPGAAQPLAAVGSARLFYLDCNNAEIRILSGVRRFDTLRLRRSRPAGNCELLE